MTVNKLHKILTAAIAAGNGRCGVCVDKPSFEHALEGDGCVILDANTANVEPVLQIDADGGHKIDSRGRECYRTCLVLRGANHEPAEERA